MPSARRARFAVAALLAALAQPATGRADSGALSFTPGDTRIEFTLGATLHTVEGTARLAQGEVRFDDASGQASGSLVIDARSAQTGNASRDRKMHGEVLESDRYPEIVFTPSRLELVRSGPDRGDAVLEGRLLLHGGEHPLRIPARIERDGGSVHLTGSFRVPYVAWGLKDVSNFIMRVDPEVEVRIDARARLSAAP
jgi:polyisoprenoid-binding protein YceI